jgi:pimeloyl-ACP methyl ester carboxylesterase
MQPRPAALPPPAFVDLPGFRLAYREWRPPEATRTVVLIHGITGSSLSWIRVAPRLARHHRVLAVDLKGHGNSDQPPSGHRIADQAGEVAAFCTGLGLGNPAVVGHSWGGAIALQLATSTGRVGRLVLEDPAISTSLMDQREWAEAEELLAGWMGLSRPEAERRASAYLAEGWSSEDVAGKIDAAARGSPASMRAIFAENGRWDLSETLPALRLPTLLLHAAPDLGGVVYPEALALAQANPHVRAVLVPGADHNIHRTRFEEFMTLVEPFLASDDG